VRSPSYGASSMGNRKDTILRLAKGFRGRRKNCFRIAVHAVHRALKYSYVSRRLRKREARRTWITQINAGAREHGLSYGKLIFGLTNAEIGVNRKMLALLAQQEPYSFRAIVDEAKHALQKVVDKRGTPGGGFSMGGGPPPDPSAAAADAIAAAVQGRARKATAAAAAASAPPTTIIELAQQLAEDGEFDTTSEPAEPAELSEALSYLAIADEPEASAETAPEPEAASAPEAAPLHGPQSLP